MKTEFKPRFERVFKTKNPVMNFLCPLCGVERGMRYRSKLGLKNYIHIVMLNIVLGLILWNLMGFKVVYMFFGVWAIYEVTHKFLFRKEVPCPHCGFDATWYKRDVRVAKKQVQDFWSQKQTVTEMQDGMPEVDPVVAAQNQEVSLDNVQF